MAKWLLAPEAQRDLEGIRRYTERNWGIDQARKYRAQLRACSDRLAGEPACGKDLASFRAGLRAMRCQHHYVVCLFEDTHVPVIIAFLHERMDLMARIAERLGLGEPKSKWPGVSPSGGADLRASRVHAERAEDSRDAKVWGLLHLSP